MKIKIISVGRKHSKQINLLIDEYQKRLKKPFLFEWNFLSHSFFDSDQARIEESQRIFDRLDAKDFVILLDERGENLSNQKLVSIFQENFMVSRDITFVIGGAFGVSGELRQRANVVWSLSKLVFPHQIVRLILIEQIYRTQEILSGGKYHHQ